MKQHKSHCAKYSAPAERKRPCDCGYDEHQAMMKKEEKRQPLVPLEQETFNALEQQLTDMAAAHVERLLNPRYLVCSTNSDVFESVELLDEYPEYKEKLKGSKEFIESFLNGDFDEYIQTATQARERELECRHKRAEFIKKEGINFDVVTKQDTALSSIPDWLETKDRVLFTHTGLLEKYDFASDCINIRMFGGPVMFSLFCMMSRPETTVKIRSGYFKPNNVVRFTVYQNRTWSMEKEKEHE